MHVWMSKGSGSFLGVVSLCFSLSLLVYLFIILTPPPPGRNRTRIPPPVPSLYKTRHPAPFTPSLPHHPTQGMPELVSSFSTWASLMKNCAVKATVNTDPRRTGPMGSSHRVGSRVRILVARLM